jgi:hypothetical protein
MRNFTWLLIFSVVFSMLGFADPSDQGANNDAVVAEGKQMHEKKTEEPHHKPDHKKEEHKKPAPKKK